MVEPPKLLELCLSFLTQHLDEVESFEGIDSALKAELLARVLRDKDRDSSLASVLKLLDENTTSIDLSEYLFNKEMAFDKLFSKMTALNTLSICGHPNLNDLVMENIVRWCPTLKTINLYKNPRISDKSIALVRASCPALERLRMRYCIGISGSGFYSDHLWEHDTVNTKAEKHKSPKKGISVIPQVPQIPYFLHLTELDIGECKSIIPTKLLPLSKLFPVLQTLAIGKLFLGDEDAEAIIKSAPPTLSNLDISYNPISFKAISALCSPAKRNQFVSLNFKSCRCVLYSAENASFIDVIRDIPNLTSLDMSLCYQIGEYDFFSEQDDKFNFAKCLQILDLSNCGNVTGKTLEHLSKFGFKHSLKELRLYGCDKLHDSILLSLLTWFPNLGLLDLGGCKSVLMESEVTAFHTAHPKLLFRTPAANFLLPGK